MLRNRTEVCIVAWFGSFGYRANTVRIFSQAKSFDNKKILNVPRYCKKAKKRKNVEKFLLMTKIAKISMEYRSHFLFKYSSLSVTFDSSRRHKMFFLFIQRLWRNEKITFLTEPKIYHLSRSVNPYEAIDITDSCSMQDMCKIWTKRTTSFSQILCGSVAVDAMSTWLSLFGFLTCSFVQCLVS